MARKIYEIAFELAGKASSSFGNMFTSANDRLQKMNRHISSLKSETRELERAQKAGKISAQEYAASYAKLSAQLEKTERAQSKLAKAQNMQQKVDKFRGRMRGNMLDAAATAVSVGAPVKMAMQFESNMADVRKVVDFDTPEQFKAMEKDILTLSKRIPMAADGLAQIVASGGQAGLARDELVEYAESAAKMGVAFDITAEEAGETMAKWRSAFKMNQDQVNTLADQINHLGNTTAAAAPDIADVVRRIGPLGEVGGAAAGEISALGASMVAAGVQPEVAATGIKNLVLGLVTGKSATKKQAEAFKSLGLNAEKMAKYMQEDAQGAILQVLGALRELPEHERAAKLQQLFGRESLGAISPLLTNLEMLEENFKKVGDAAQYAGSMEKEFETRSQTTENAMILLQNSMKALAITGGSLLLPHLAELSRRAAKVGDAVAGFAEKYPGLTKVIVVGTAAVLGMGVAFTALGYAASLIASPFVGLYGLITKYTTAQNTATVATNRVTLAQRAGALATKSWAAAQWLWNTAMSMNPIGLVILSIAGLITIGTAMYKNFESVRNIVDSVWGSFKETFPNAAQLVESVGVKVGALWDKLRKFWHWLTGKGGGNASTPDVGSLRKMDTYSRGGFANRPSIFGEDGPEAAIPLDGSPRALALWAQTGRMLGVKTAKTGGSGEIKVTYSPNYQIYGGGKDVEASVRKAAGESQKDFAKLLKSIQHQERRLKYG